MDIDSAFEGTIEEINISYEGRLIHVWRGPGNKEDYIYYYSVHTSPNNLVFNGNEETIEQAIQEAKDFIEGATERRLSSEQDY